MYRQSLFPHFEPFQCQPNKFPIFISLIDERFRVACGRRAKEISSTAFYLAFVKANERKFDAHFRGGRQLNVNLKPFALHKLRT